MSDSRDDTQDDIETWEIQVAGAVAVLVFDPMKRDYKPRRVGGPAGSKRLRISKRDRLYNQEQVLVENKHRDPFSNGVLAKVVDGVPETNYGLKDLKAMLEIRDPEPFGEIVAEIAGDELQVRRLFDLARTDGTMWQVDALQQVINERYKVGGTQRTVQEMIDAGEKVGGTVLS